MRLRRADCSRPGLTRRVRGRGFEYRDPSGTSVRDPETLARIRALAIPPAWRDVWICPDPLGHLQATGVDAAGRKQYLYHERWRARRDREKFDHMIELAHALPALRARVSDDLAAPALSRERVLACAVRLLDRGFFRIGGESYAEGNGTYGLVTIRREHVLLRGGATILFDYPSKAGQRRVQAVVDELAYDTVASLMRRRSGDELLAYRNGRRWVDVRSADVNGYIKDTTGGDFSAKDFRTWHATVLAAVTVAVYGREARSRTARKRVAGLAIREVAHYLGNTPAVCRASYVDPRVLDRFDAGVTIGIVDTLADEPGPPVQPEIEAAVIALLEGDLRADAPERRAA